MEPTTMTTIVMISVCHRRHGWAVYCWFSDWQPAVRRYLTEEETGGRDPSGRTADAAGYRGLRARRTTPLV